MSPGPPLAGLILLNLVAAGRLLLFANDELAIGNKPHLFTIDNWQFTFANL
jgi:hypothetical protein